jgi:nitrate reductase delta subunit
MGLFTPRARNTPLAGTLRALAALIAYPDAALREALPQLRELLRAEGALAVPRLAGIEALIDTVAAADPLDAEADYVQLFDCGRATSLHLFEHVHGDSRERGPALVDLAQTYEKSGLFLAPGELPDYLPVLIEFASTQPPAIARGFLAETAHILNALHGALAARGSRYAEIPAALVELAGGTVAAVPPAAEPALDDSWREPPVFDGCSTAGQSRPGAPQPVRIVRNNANTGAAA